VDFALLLGICSALALVGLGGGIYEMTVVDPAWPRRPDLIQPAKGGLSRKRFWIPAHLVFEVTLVASLVLAWSSDDVRQWLFVALASHVAMRAWSALDFIPKALRFERDADWTVEQARRWTMRSRLRLPLDLITCGALVVAFTLAVGGR
jgi:hypothetical protein